MTYRLFQMQDSGNCYKIRLLLAHLRQPCEIVEVDILKGESRTSEFLQRNPNGRVPTLQIDTKTFLAESNAILWYLASDTRFQPTDRLAQARMLQWMFFEQYSHEPFIATSRFWISIVKQPDQYAAQIKDRRMGGLAALAVMEQHLATRSFFVDDAYSIADIALYAYTHVADEGGFSLDDCPAINAWMSRVQQQAGYIAMNTAYPDFT